MFAKCGIERSKSVFASAAMLAIASALALSTVALAGCQATAQSGNGDSVSFTPSFSDASFDAQAAATNGIGSIDLSHIEQGYVGACASSSRTLKFQVSCDGQVYNYDLPADGTPIICPLNMGDGTYSFRIMENTSANRYAELFATEADVTLDSEFEPYLRPNVICSYSSDSACVAKAREIAADASTESQALDAVCQWVTENVTYDTALAATAPDGYVPDPDSTFESGTGICYDYASLTAAMLRSMGIPCKIVVGYVEPGNIYHAWNMVYLDEGWTTVGMSGSAHSWGRIDTTFASAGAADSTGDGSSYTGKYTY